MQPRTSLLVLAGVIGLGAPCLYASDWPRWRGVNADGISTETGWLGRWSGSGPKQLWKANVGTGYSSLAVADERAFTMGHNDGKDTVFCFDANSGKELWRYSYEAKLDDHYYEGGPSATPTVDGD